MTEWNAWTTPCGGCGGTFLATSQERVCRCPSFEREFREWGAKLDARLRAADAEREAKRAKR